MKMEKNPLDDLPLEVKPWIDRGWKITPSERKGIVLTGEKVMSTKTKFYLVMAVLIWGLAFANFLVALILSVLFALVAWLNHRYLTKPPTHFFPAPGDAIRTLKRE